MVSVDALRIYKVFCIVELGLGEKAGLLQPLGQGLPAAADGGLQTVVGDIGHMGPRKGLAGEQHILPVGEGPAVQGPLQTCGGVVDSVDAVA